MDRNAKLRATSGTMNIHQQVMQFSGAKTQQSASRGTLKEQEGMIADTNGSTKITFWEKFTDICQEGKTYIFKHLKVKKYAGTKYLATPYNEGCDIQETDDLVGETAQIDEQQQLTTLEFLSLSKNFACAGCHFSIKNTSTEPLITCTNCNPEQKRASCPSSWFARLLIMSVEQKVRKAKLFSHQVVTRLISRMFLVFLQGQVTSAVGVFM